MTGPVFTRDDGKLGRFTLRPVDPMADVELVHSWLTDPKAVFWGMSDAAVGTVERYLREIAVSSGRDAFLGSREGTPVFLLERYDPEVEGIGTIFPVSEGDVGMHVLVAPADTPVHGLTGAVMVTIMEFLFSDPAAARVVVEPDVRNRPVHVLNARVGFQELATVPLGGKQALLSTCTRSQFHATRPATAGRYRREER